jgi:hypothetical protein
VEFANQRSFLYLCGMKYVPYYELNQPNIIVDGSPNQHTILTLSHWPKSPTPQELKDDLSTQIVFHYLDRPDLKVAAEAVSNNHFDEDGLVSLYVMVNPEKASYWRDLLIDVAAAGDFGTYRIPEAARAAFTVAAYADAERSPLPKDIFHLSYPETTAALYREMIGILPDIILSPEKYRRFWKPQEEDLHSSEAAIQQGAILIEEIPDVDLAVVSVPEEIGTCHTFALHNATRCFRILMIKGHSYEFRYRYESWVEYVSQPVPPRIDLTKLAERLSNDEENGSWVFEGVDEITPRMYLQDSKFSSIPQNEITRRIVEFLRKPE